jgi:hypothetical protein
MPAILRTPTDNNAYAVTTEATVTQGITEKDAPVYDDRLAYFNKAVAVLSR